MTTSNMGLTIPGVLVTLGPDYASDINDDLDIIDSHSHLPGSGVLITPGAMNINADLEFNNHNATELRSLRLQNETTFTPAVTDRTCLYALNDELYYIDGAGNNIQLTLNGSIDLTVTSLTIRDTQFTLEYFGDITRKALFSCANIPAASTITYSFPNVSSDTLVTNTSTSTMTNKTLTTPTITQIKTGTPTFTLPTADGTAGQVLATNGSAVLSFAASLNAYSQTDINSSGTPFNALSSSSTEVVITGSSLSFLQGIVAGVAGQRLTVRNGGTDNVTIVPLSGSASTGNKIKTPNGKIYYLTPNNNTSLTYDGTTGFWNIDQQSFTVAVSDNSSALQYQVGELLDTGSVAVSVSNNSATNISQLALSSGDWDIFASGCVQGTLVTTGAVDLIVGISTTTNTLTGTVGRDYNSSSLNIVTTGLADLSACVSIPVSLSGTTTYYLVGYQSNPLASARSISGSMYARRRR